MTASFARLPHARLSQANASHNGLTNTVRTAPKSSPKSSRKSSLRVAALPLALPLFGASWLAGSLTPAQAEEAAADWSGGPRYTYFDAGYQWVDSNYAVRQDGGHHNGIKLNVSQGILEAGRIGVHLFGEFFDGTFSGVRTTCDGGEGGSTSFSGDRDSQSLAGGLGLSFAVAEKTDIVVRGAYLDIPEFETPNNLCQLVSGDDSGYFGEVMVRSELSDKVEIEAGFRYSDLSDSDISTNDALLGLGYHVTDFLTIRARGVVFDDDTGIEISARLYFGTFLGRDSIF